jgi:hypothetical protein
METEGESGWRSGITGQLTCMQRSELLIPPSTANSVSLCLLSFSMASSMALVWKHVASSVALATWPRFVYAVMPTKDLLDVSRYDVLVL